jgi:hypothetical protein
MAWAPSRAQGDAAQPTAEETCSLQVTRPSGCKNGRAGAARGGGRDPATADDQVQSAHGREPQVAGRLGCGQPGSGGRRREVDGAPHSGSMLGLAGWTPRC